MARIRALLRVAMLRSETGPTFDDGNLRVDLAQREVALQGQPVALTRKEFALLAQLVEQASRVVPQT